MVSTAADAMETIVPREVNRISSFQVFFLSLNSLQLGFDGLIRISMLPPLLVNQASRLSAILESDLACVSIFMD